MLLSHKGQIEKREMQRGLRQAATIMQLQDETIRLQHARDINISASPFVCAFAASAAARAAPARRTY